MSIQESPDATRQAATPVGENERETFLPALFGHRHFFVAEHTLYNFMGWLSPQDYGGGFWEFYALNGKPLYLVPPDRPDYRIKCETNGFEGTVTADAAGIIVTLFTFSHLSFKFESDVLSEGYQRLYAYAAEHPEASAIFGAID